MHITAQEYSSMHNTNNRLAFRAVHIASMCIFSYTSYTTLIFIDIQLPESLISCHTNTHTHNTYTHSDSDHRYSNTMNNLAFDMMTECGFSQVVNFPTRLNNILDILCTNRPSFIQYYFPAPDHITLP